MNPTEVELVLQMQAGNLEALGLLYDRYRQMVFRTALAITGDRDAANDLLQDVFLRLFRFADHIDPQRPLEPWLYRMTTNLSYSWIKRHRRWLRPLEDLVEWIAGSGKDTPHEAAEFNEDWRELQQGLLALPIQQRVVIVLYYLNDLSLQEISEILEVPVGTIKSRLHYGRIALRKSLGMLGFPEGEHLPDFN
jgi:RNA polymerase sigma-70 factor (ECF subfamily)